MNVDCQKQIESLPGFALRLSIAIEQEDLRESHLAESTGISADIINQFTRGRIEPSILDLVCILRALPGVNARWLICG